MLIHCKLSNINLFCLSDLHIDADTLESFKELFKLVEDRGVDGVLLLGDIADGEYSKRALEYLQKDFSPPVMYILGNHDFYHHSCTAFPGGLSLGWESGR